LLRYPNESIKGLLRIREQVDEKMRLRAEPVEDIRLRKNMTIRELCENYLRSGGFTAKKLGVAVEIMREMLSDPSARVFLSFPACIIATGTRGVIRDMVKKEMVDVIVTTCGTVDHDLARVWKRYYHGDFLMDDRELHRKGINRLGNILVPNDSYGLILEKKLQPMLEDIYSQGINNCSVRELVHEIGKRVEDENSILHWTSKKNIPVFIPGPTDGSFGAQIWSFRQTHPKFVIDVLKDENELADIVFSTKKAGALMIGGGISKHHVIWWNQFRDGLDWAVYLTTAEEWDGSLSGARCREAISWGKIKERAREVTVEGDATITLPILIGALL